MQDEFLHIHYALHLMLLYRSTHFLVLSSLIILGRGETVYWGKGRRWEYLFFWVVVVRRRLKGGLESLSPDDYFLSHAN